METSRRASRKEADRRRKEDEILDAALGLFAVQGYERTTLEDIADTLGYAKTSLYYYFPGKEAIVKALIYGAMEEADRRMAELLARSDDPVENLRDLIGNYIDDHTSRRGFFNIYHQVGHFMDSILSPEEREAMGRSMADMNGKIIGMVRRGIDRGHYLDLDPQTLGELVLGMVSGIMNQMSLKGPQGFDRETLKPTIVEILIQGIRRQEKP